MRRLLLLVLLTSSACGGSEDDPPATCAPACSGDNVCIAGACQPMFPASYRMVASASLAAKDPDGDCWDDPFCGDPDLLVTVSVDGRVVGQTSEEGGTFTHTWTEEPIVTTLNSGSMLELIAYDVDVNTNDVVTRCAVTVNSELVRSGVIRCNAAAGESTVSATIQRDVPAM